MEAKVQTQAKNISEFSSIQNSLQTIAKNVNAKNLAWFAEITKRPNFDEKLESKKGFINTFL